MSIAWYVSFKNTAPDPARNPVAFRLFRLRSITNACRRAKGLPAGDARRRCALVAATSMTGVVYERGAFDEALRDLAALRRATMGEA